MIRERAAAERDVHDGGSVGCSECRKEFSMGLILLIVIILLLVGGLPNWGYSRNWGYGPSGGLGLVLLILLILLLMGRLNI